MSQRSERLPGQILGDYRLVRMVSRGAGVKVWEAEQISVRRAVILEILRQDWVKDEAVRRSFIEDARAKARVNHAVVGHVYEAADSDEATFLAREALEGATIEQHRLNGLKLRPREVATQLKAIAYAFLYFERQNFATVALSDQHLHFDVVEKSLRMANVVRDGAVDPNLPRADKETVAAIYRDLLEEKKPGSVRVLSLLDHLGNAERAIPVTWQQLADLSSEIEDTLPLPEDIQADAAGKKLSKQEEKQAWKRVALMLGAAAVCLIAAFFAKKEDVTTDRKWKGTVPAVRWVRPKPEGAEFSSTPVRRDQFAEFLQEKGDEFLPLDWGKQWGLLTSEQRRKVAGKSVNGVSLQGAKAYARWKKAKLPAVTDYQVMQGRISQFKNLASPGPEWTATSDVHPNQPLEAARPIAIFQSERLLAPSSDAQFSDVTFRLKR